MQRREFLLLSGSVGLLLAAKVRRARAQQPATMPVVGFLRSGTPTSVPKERLTAFRQGLREGGFVEGRDCAVEYRWGTIAT